MKQLIFSLIISLTVWASNAQTVTFSKRIDIDKLPDTGWGVLETDSGFVVWAIGRSNQFNTYYGIHLINTDRRGNVLWVKSLGENGKFYLIGRSKAFQKADDGFIGCGTIQDSLGYNSFLVRYNDQGDTLWLRQYGGNYDSGLYGCLELPNGNVVAAGYTQNMGDTLNDFHLVSTDSLGNIEWESKYGSPYWDVATSLDRTPYKGFVIGGGTFGAGAGSLDNLLVKTDSSGTLEWYKTFGTSKEDCGLEVRTSRYGGYYVWGCMDTLKPSASGTTPYVAKLDSIGNVIWRKFFTKVTEHSIWDFEELPSGNIVFLGIKHTYDFGPEEGWIVKMDSDGNILWERMYKYLEHPTSDHITSWFRGFRPTSDGGFIITGMCSVGWNDVDTTDQDIWLLKLDSMGCLVPGCDTLVPCPEPCDTTGISETATLQAKLYPNPTTGTLTIELPGGQGGSIALYNLLGQGIYSAPIAGGQTTLALNLPPGLYLYRIGSGNQATNGKLLVE